MTAQPSPAPSRWKGARARQIRTAVVLPIVAILLAVLIGSLFVYAAAWIKDGQVDIAQPLRAYWALIDGSLLTYNALLATTVAATPLIFGGLAVALGFKAGLFNIGVTGQLLMGVLGSVAVGVALADQPPLAAWPLAFLAGTICGGLYGMIPGALKAYSGAHEVVTTIMLNYIAGFILAAAISGPLRVPQAQAPVSYGVGNAELPTLLREPGHIGILIALVMVALVWLLLYRTTLGFEIRTAGVNPDAARYAGMRPRRLVILAMTMSGALAGMAGANELLGVTHLTQTSFPTSVGFDSIAVALLARSSPIAIIPAAILFGALRAGAGQMQIEAKTPRELVDVLQAVILIVLVALPVLARALRGRGAQDFGADAATITRSYGSEFGTVELMDQFLYSIPILGLAFQMFGYLIDVLPTSAPIILRAATPIAFGALCGVVCERSGVVNIGIEGTMLTAAFTGWVVGIAANDLLGPFEPGPMGVTPALLIGLAGGVLSAVAISGLHAWMSISLRVDQIISGTIINIAAFGITGYLNNVVAAASPTSAGQFEKFTPPEFLTSLPVVGWLFTTIFNQGPITLSLLVFVVGLQVWLFRSRWGLRTRAVGEHPKAAETVGIDVIRLRYRNVLIGGAFAGLGGAFLSMELSNSFQAGGTAGRGFIALAAMIVGRWTPIGSFGAALLFSLFLTLGQTITFVPPTGSLGDLVAATPPQLFSALPYIVTIVVLAGLIGKSTPPAADGKPYEREATT